MSLTTDKNNPCINKPKGEGQQNECYLILSEEERTKGFIRPIRRSYKHIGRNLDFNKMRDMTDEDKEKYKNHKDYVGFIPNEDEESALVRIIITQEDINHTKCGCVTTMALELAETYARNPKFYGATWCMNCKEHLPVEEFI